MEIPRGRLVGTGRPLGVQRATEVLEKNLEGRAWQAQLQVPLNGNTPPPLIDRDYCSLGVSGLAYLEASTATQPYCLRTADPRRGQLFFILSRPSPSFHDNFLFRDNTNKLKTFLSVIHLLPRNQLHTLLQAACSI